MLNLGGDESQAGYQEAPQRERAKGKKSKTQSQMTPRGLAGGGKADGNHPLYPKKVDGASKISYESPRDSETKGGDNADSGSEVESRAR